MQSSLSNFRILSLAKKEVPCPLAVTPYSHWPLQNINWIRIVLFNVHIFMSFLNLFLLYLIMFFSETMLCIILIFNYLGMLYGLTWFVLENVSCTLEMTLYSVVGWCVLHIYFVKVVGSVVQVFSFLIYLLSGYFIHYWKQWIEFSNYYYWIVYFSFQFFQVSIHKFRGCIDRGIHACNYYIFRMDWSFMIISCPSLSLVTIFILKSTLLDTGTAKSCFLFITVCIVSLFYIHSLFFVFLIFL